MIDTNQKIVEEAREWLGTKWQHQASFKGVATDCVGLVRGVYTEVTGKAVVTEADYHRLPLPGREDRLIEEIAKYAVQIVPEKLRPGDILLFRFMDGSSNHIGIYSGNGQFIHAWQDVYRVVETPYSDEWKRITKAVFRVREGN